MNWKKAFTLTSFNLSSVCHARLCAGSFYQEFDGSRTFLLYKKAGTSSISTSCACGIFALFFPSKMYKKTAKTLDFSGFSGMDLRGIEPLSESLFIQASPITVILLKVPPSARRMTGLPLR